MKRKTMIKARYASVVLALILAFAHPAAVFAEEAAPADAAQEETVTDPSVPPEIESASAVMIDADTGRVLYEKEKDAERSPASMTKIMTALLALENGNLTDKVTMTETGVALAFSGSSNLYTQVGEEFTLEQLLYGTMVKSANDMATQIGEYIGGTLDEFIVMMNGRAASLGCEHTHFANACGYPDDDNYSSAYDMAMIAREADKIDIFRTMAGTQQYVIPQTAMTDHDRVFETHIIMLSDEAYAGYGVYAGKTGYTDIAGNCLTSFVEKDGLHLIVVTMYAMGAETAAADTAKILDYGFANYERIAISHEEYPDYASEATVKKGTGAADLTMTEDIENDGEQDIHVFRYLEGDETAGEIRVPQSVYDEVEAAKITETPTPEPTPEITETPAPVPTAVPEKETLNLPHSVPELISWLDEGPNRLLFILVVLIIICLIIAIVLRLKRAGRKHRKKRKREKRDIID